MRLRLVASSLFVASLLVAGLSSCAKDAPVEPEPVLHAEPLTNLAIPNPQPTPFGWFGYAVEGMGNGRIAVGAPGNDTLAPGSTPYGVVFSLTTAGAVAQQGDGQNANERLGSSLAEAGGILVAGGAGAGGSGDPQIIRWLDANDLFTQLGVAMGMHGGSAFGSSVAVGNGRVYGGGPLTDNPTGPRLDLGIVIGTQTSGVADSYWPTLGGTETAGSRYGAALALVGTQIAVGGPGFAEGGFASAGHVVLLDPSYTPVRTIANPMPAAGDEFGAALAYDGRLLIGAPKDDPNGVPDAGTVYIANPISGVITAVINNPNPQTGDRFGQSIASVANGNAILIGAPGHSQGANAGIGIAYVFDASGTLLGTVENPQPDAGDEFGFSVAALSGSGYLIGAPFDDPGLVLDAGSVYVFAGGHAPTVADRAVTATEDTPLMITMTANDPDIGDVHTWAVTAAPLNGAVSIAGSVLTYFPNPNYFGNDVFRVQANDGLFPSNVAIVEVTVDPVNDAPAALTDTYYCFEDQVLSIPSPGVLFNDSDVDSTLFATKIADVQNGMLYFDAFGGFIYTPNTNYVGSDSFTYEISDGTNAAQAMVTINVSSVNDAPVGGVIDFAYTEDTTLVAPAGSLDPQDPDATSFTYALMGPPARGTATLGTDGSFTYVPRADDCSETSFYVTVTDDSGVPSDVAAKLTGACVNDTPEIPTAQHTTNGGTVVIDTFVEPVLYVLGKDPDLSPDNLEELDRAVWTLSSPGGGTPLSGEEPFVWNGAVPLAHVTLPLDLSLGSHTFTAQAFDDSGASSPVMTVTLQVTGGPSHSGAGCVGKCTVSPSRPLTGTWLAVIALALTFVRRRRVAG